MEYLVNIKSLVLTAKNKKEAQRQAEKQLEKGFKLSDMMIIDIEKIGF